MKNKLNNGFTFNTVLILIGVFVFSAAVVGAYYVGRRGSENNLTPSVQTVVLPTATAAESTAASTSTFTQEIPATETPDPQTAVSNTPADTDTPDFALATTLTTTPAETAVNPTQTVQVKLTQAPDQAKLIKNILPSNGGYFPPKKNFEKSWVIQNTGTSTWTEKYKLVFFSGTAMTNNLSFPIQTPVKPGKSITIVIEQTTPKEPGIYDGFWMLQNESGKTFGIGSDGKQPLLVRATVLNITKDNSLDFILEYCNATWWNSEGETINCQGVPRQINGFVLLDRNPFVENGPSDLPGLWVHPYQKEEAGISGKYPLYQIKDGDHFRAQVGCIAGNPDCNITFKLLYNNGTGPNMSLGTWQELYGGGITKINLDLSALAGEEVQFILRTIVSNNTPEDANGIWLIPRITNE